jgi:hypothetical protein
MEILWNGWLTTWGLVYTCRVWGCLFSCMKRALLWPAVENNVLSLTQITDDWCYKRAAFNQPLDHSLLNASTEGMASIVTVINKDNTLPWLGARRWTWCLKWATLRVITSVYQTAFNADQHNNSQFVIYVDLIHCKPSSMYQITQLRSSGTIGSRHGALFTRVGFGDAFSLVWEELCGLWPTVEECIVLSGNWCWKRAAINADCSTRIVTRRQTL